MQQICVQKLTPILYHLKLELDAKLSQYFSVLDPSCIDIYFTKFCANRYLGPHKKIFLENENKQDYLNIFN